MCTMNQKQLASTFPPSEIDTSSTSTTISTSASSSSPSSSLIRTKEHDQEVVFVNKSRDPTTVVQRPRTSSIMSNSSNRSTVSFKDITIHEHNVIIGDNPACSSGCPVRYVNDKGKAFFSNFHSSYLTFFSPIHK